MQRFGMTARLKPERVEEYKRLHAAVWPKVLEIIAACQTRNYSIYLHGNLIFSHFEYHGHDFAADMQKMADDPTTQEWWSVCVPCFEGVDIDDRSTWWTGMEEVFHLD